MSFFRRAHTPTIEELVDLQLRVWGENTVRKHYDDVLRRLARHRTIRRRLTTAALALAIVAVAASYVSTEHHWRRLVGGQVASLSPSIPSEPLVAGWGVVGPADPALATIVSGVAHSGPSSLRTGNDGKRSGALIATYVGAPWTGTRYFSAWLKLPDEFGSRSKGPWLIMRWGDPFPDAHARMRGINVWLRLNGQRLTVSVESSGGTTHTPATLVRNRWAHIELAIGDGVPRRPTNRDAQVWIDTTQVFSSIVDVGPLNAQGWSVGLRSASPSHDFVFWADRAIATHYVA